MDRRKKDVEFSKFPMPHWSLTRLAGSAQLMVRLACAEFGLARERCLAGTGLTENELVDPTVVISGKQELGVLRNILRALGPAVPFAFTAGMRYRATSHGPWGFAVMSSANVREAIDLMVRYADLSYTFNKIELETRQGAACVSMGDEDNPEDLRAALVERDLGAIVSLSRDALGHMVAIRMLELRARRPPYAVELEAHLGVAAHWGANVNRVTLASEQLELSGPLADELGKRVSEDQCRSLIDQQRAHSGVSGRVRMHLMRRLHELPDMEAIAAELGMTGRTLRNQLRREATTYRALVEQVRIALADELLSSRDLSIDQIAQRLGYADPSSFIAAFKRWKGVPPRSYRSSKQVD